MAKKLSSSQLRKLFEAQQKEIERLKAENQALKKQIIKKPQKGKKQKTKDYDIKDKKGGQKKARTQKPTAKELKTSEREGAKSSGKAKKGQKGQKPLIKPSKSATKIKNVTTQKWVVGIPFPKKSEAEKEKTRKRQAARAIRKKKTKYKKQASKPVSKKKKGKKQAPAKLICKYRYQGKCLSKAQMEKVAEIYRRLQGIGLKKQQFKQTTGGKRYFASYQLIIDTLFDYIRYYLGISPDVMPVLTDKTGAIIKVAATIGIVPNILSSDYSDARNNLDTYSKRNKINTVYFKQYNSEDIKLVPKSRFAFLFELVHDKIQQKIRETCEREESEKCSPRIEFEQAIETEFTKIVYYDFNRLGISGVDQDIIDEALEEAKEEF